MDLLMMRPSQWRRLEDTLQDPGEVDALLMAIFNLLDSSVNDGGVETDRVYTAAVQLSGANVWQHIDESKLVRLLSGIPPRSVMPFLQGMPGSVRVALYEGLKNQELTVSGELPGHIADNLPWHLAADEDEDASASYGMTA